MNIANLLRQAWEAVQHADLPAEIQPSAFEKAVELLATGAPARTPREVPSNSSPSGRPGDESPAYQFAEKLDLPADAAREIFRFGPDSEVEVILGTQALDTSNAGAVRQLALLVAGARQYGLGEEWTAADEIRSQAEHFGKADTNFATYLRNMTDEFSFHGKGVNRKVRLRKPGQERLRALVASLTGGTTD